MNVYVTEGKIVMELTDEDAVDLSYWLNRAKNDIPLIGSNRDEINRITNMIFDARIALKSKAGGGGIKTGDNNGSADANEWR